MATEAAPGRPRPWLLVALAVVAGIFLVMRLLPDNSAPAAAVSSKPRVAATTASKGDAAIDPADLRVRLDELNQPRPGSQGGARNPFRFYVPPPPPPPPAPVMPKGPPTGPLPIESTVPSGPPPPPPIAVKYIGFMDTPTGKIANFSDCRSTYRGREGEIVAGQYRLVRIGVESAVMEYPDGRGRTTLRMSGQECVGK
ncbi:MAG: hypothetical protein ABJC89_11555 [Acidobacteriota bacterium]